MGDLPVGHTLLDGGNRDAWSARTEVTRFVCMATSTSMCCSAQDTYKQRASRCRAALRVALTALTSHSKRVHHSYGAAR